MNIETKFNVGDEVFIMHNGRLNKRAIKSISIDIRTERDLVVSTLYNVGSEPEGIFRSKFIFYEDELFGSKEELIKATQEKDI